MSPIPDVSVVIPSCDRSQSVLRLLTALSGEHLPGQQLQVLVVLDGCTDDTRDRIARQFPFELVILEQARAGAASARNLGASKARASLLLFLDDDLEPEPGLVAEHLRMHQSRPSQVVIGPCLCTWSGKLSLARIQQRAWWNDRYLELAEPGHRFTFRDMLSGNFSIETSLFHLLGGFDESFSNAGGEDYEFGIRLIREDVRFVFAPGARALHHDGSDQESSFRRARQEGRADVLIGTRHPEIVPALMLAKFGAEESRRDRLLRGIAFRWRMPAAALVSLLRLGLLLFEKLNLRRPWSSLYVRLRRYWYWRGVADAIPSASCLQSLLARSPDGEPQPSIELNLEEERCVNEQLLDRLRPHSVLLKLGQQVIGNVEPLAGAERLRGVHLQGLLAGRMSGRLAIALAIQEFAKRTAVPPPGVGAPASQAADRRRVAEIDLARGLESISFSDGPDPLPVLIRDGSHPLGWIWLPHQGRETVPPSEVGDEIIGQLGRTVARQRLFRRAGEGEASSSTAISVVVCTRDRPSTLSRCLQALRELTYPDFEIIVVDNAPTDGRTREIAHAHGVRYVDEQRRGLDRARNKGLQVARHSIVAFIDDDAVPGPQWLHAIGRAFDEPDVMGVTGPVLPLELRTQAQICFEFGYGGMSHGFSTRRIRSDACSVRQLLQAHSFGVGTNMAFRKDLAGALGGFDPALDVGTATGGCGDVEWFHRIVACGQTILYDAQTFVYHAHRREMRSLHRQTYNNGRGFGSYLLTCRRNHTVPTWRLACFAVSDALGWILLRVVRPRGVPRSVYWVQLAGLFASPLHYVVARAQALNVRRLHPEVLLGRRLSGRNKAA